MMQLEAGLAGERQAQHVARDAGDIGVHVLQEPRWVVEADAAQQLARQRAGHVDRAERQRAIEDVHVETPRLDPVADPRLGERRAAGRERQHETIVSVVGRLATHHAVVDQVAALVEQQHVAAAAGADVVDRRRVDALQGLDHIGAGHDHLAQRRHVAERHALANRPVLVEEVAVVPRSPPSAEAVHPCPEGEVLVVQRRAPERVEVHVGGGLADRQLARCRAAGERRGRLAGLGGRRTTAGVACTRCPGTCPCRTARLA